MGLNSLLLYKLQVHNMRLYFVDIKENQISNMPLEQCIKTIKEYTFLISLDGIYKVVRTNDCLVKLTYIDKSAKEVKIDNWNVLIDYTEPHLKDNLWRLPYDSIPVKVYEETYILREKSNLKFIILRQQQTEKIIDFYFVFNGDIENFAFKEDILTFLSDIK